MWVKNMTISQMVMENYILTMGIFYRVNLKMVDAKGKEDGSNLTVVIMKGTLKITLQTVMESILM